MIAFTWEIGRDKVCKFAEIKKQLMTQIEFSDFRKNINKDDEVSIKSLIFYGQKSLNELTSSLDLSEPSKKWVKIIGKFIQIFYCIVNLIVNKIK
jgi:hypothetical protein